jgi:hypothetical protein
MWFQLLGNQFLHRDSSFFCHQICNLLVKMKIQLAKPKWTIFKDWDVKSGAAIGILLNNFWKINFNKLQARSNDLVKKVYAFPVLAFCFLHNWNWKWLFVLNFFNIMAQRKVVTYSLLVRTHTFCEQISIFKAKLVQEVP